MKASETTQEGATVVITHRVREGKQADYDNWLNEISPLCRTYPGHLDCQIVRPIAGLTETYTVIIRFDTCPNLRKWLESSDRQRLIERVRPHLALDDAYTIHSGLDFWFMPAGTGGNVPVRWKQSLVTWSAIYPLVLGIPLLVGPLLRPLGWHENRYLTTLFGTAIVVLLMTYLVMPRYTKLVRHWLFN